MPKTLQEALVTTREARKRLPPGLHWRVIDTDVHLGYRKGKRAGVWLVRWRSGSGYRQAPLGAADDILTGDNLDFRAAVRAAVEHVRVVREEAKAISIAPPVTVESAVRTYSTTRDARYSRRAGRPTRANATTCLERYVIGRPKRGNRAAIALSPLAGVALRDLTDRKLREWREGLPQRLMASATQRVVNYLKAALNEAAERERDCTPTALPIIIKSGLRMPFVDDDEAVPIARENQILSDEQISELLRVARDVDFQLGFEGDLYRLLLVMASTGARFSQVARIRVIDVQADAKRLMVPASRKGRGRKPGLTPVPVGEDVLKVIGPCFQGRPREAILLSRWHYEQRPGSIQWHRTQRGQWRTPSEIVRPWGIIRDQVGLPEVVPYALRHSSIVRSIRANLPLRLVAALHDTSVVMIERHYARYIADGLDGLAASAVVPLVAT